MAACHVMAYVFPKYFFLRSVSQAHCQIVTKFANTFRVDQALKPSDNFFTLPTKNLAGETSNFADRRQLVAGILLLPCSVS